MSKAAASGKIGRPGRREPRPPDDALLGRGGVAYRYVLRLAVVDDAAVLLRVLGESGIPLSYLLLVPADPSGHVAYVGLGGADVADLPYRLALQGIAVERGEELGAGGAR